MSAVDDFKRNQRFAVCVDSDGCAMDTMTSVAFAASARAWWKNAIPVSHEAESWKRFPDEALVRFTKGNYAGAYQQALNDAFNANPAK